MSFTAQCTIKGEGRFKIYMKINAYTVISERIDQGVKVGYRRAFKYTEHPDEDYVIETIANEVLNALSEVIIWDDVGDLGLDQASDRVIAKMGRRNN